VLNLKKTIVTISLLLLLGASACGNGNSSSTSFSFEYSNMVDSNTQTFVKNLLSENGVREDNIECFFKYVNDFYNGYEGIADNGWTTVELKDFSYSDGSAFEHWGSKERSPLDLNCRFAAFILARDIVSFGNNSHGEAIAKDENLLTSFTDESTQNYFALFCDIDTNNEMNLTDNFLSVRKQYDITFNEEDTIKLLCLYTRNETSHAQVFHAAVLIEENDCYYLIEKYDPMYPYQISKFNSQDEIISYIFARCRPEKVANIKDALITINNAPLVSKSF
jgi:outer membrane lipoprotein-sorting protein